MNLIEPVLMEFEIESANTRKALDRVPESAFDWQPHEKSWTMCKLASHIAEIPEWLGAIYGMDEMVLDGEMDYTPFVAKSEEELMARYDAAVAGAVETMKASDPEKWPQMWRMKKGGEVAFEAPRIAVVKSFLINHAIQHRGQLTVYLRMNGVPVPAIYGPSADEEGM